MKLLTFASACLLLALTASPPQAEDVAPTPIKALELFRLEGRAWSFELTRWQRGSHAQSGQGQGHVASVGDGVARYSESYRIGSSSSQASFDVDLGEPVGDHALWADESLPEETLDLGFARFVCRRHVAVEGHLRITTWVSAEYHPLIVKQVRLGRDSCEIRTLKSFDDGSIDRWGIYKVEGRRIKYESENGNRHVLVVRSYNKDGVTLERTVLDAGGVVTVGPETETLSFEEVAQRFAFLDEAQHKGTETVRVQAGEFECAVYETTGGRVYLSTQWPGLPVKGVQNGEAFELVELDLGHDDGRMNRRAGNYFVTRTKTSFGGVESEVQLRTEVKSVVDGKAQLELTSLDDNGVMLFQQQMESSVTERPERLTPYSGQVEENITTPAGTFRCIRRSIGGTSTHWLYHGVVIRMEMRNQAMTMIQEVIELNME